MREELQLAMETAREAGQLMLRYYGGDYAVRNKQGTAGDEIHHSVRDADYDPVTNADLEADACLRKRLMGSYPEYGWLSEETADSPDRLPKEAVWIVDPMDGTKEFVEEIPEFVVSVALVERGEPVVAVIYNPPADDIYVALKGGGAFVNGTRVFCTDTPVLEKAVVGVSRSEMARGEVDAIESHVREIRPIGSVAYKLAVVAAGAADMNISVQPKNEWDVCAGDLLVREATGLMVDLEGEVRLYNQPDPLIRGGLVAGNPTLTGEMLELLAKI